MYERKTQPKAQKEHIAHALRYERLRDGLGSEYLQDFGQTISLLCENPMRRRVYLKPDIRRIALSKFPYRILYRVVGNEVQILAVGHKSKRNEYWEERAASF